MVSGPSSIGGMGDIPQIHYRPDPGEPAARLSAPPTQTALLVTAQEQRNETRLRSRAVVLGEDIIYSRITFDVGVGNSSPVYNAGLTTLVTRTGSDGVLPGQTSPISSPAEEEQVPSTHEEEDEEENQAASELSETSSEQDRLSEQELDEEENELESEDTRLNRNLAIAFLKQEQALEDGDPVEFQQAQREASTLERELEELEKEEREIELERFARQLEEFQESTGEVLEDSLSTAIGLLDVMFGLGENNDSPNNQPNP